jgi:hypothetical protein
LIAEIRRNSNYPAADWRALSGSEPLDLVEILRRLRLALDEAEEFVAAMPTEKMGLPLLTRDKAVQLDPQWLQDYRTHTGWRRGHWPGSPEISAAMLERYRKP